MDKIKLPNFYVDKEVEEYTNKEMAKIKGDSAFFKLIKSLGNDDNPVSERILIENVARLSEYHEDYLICKKCPGYSNCPKSNLHTKISYDFDGRFLNKHIDLCEKEVEKINYDSCFYFQDFPYDWSDISTISTDDDRKKATRAFKDLGKNGNSQLLYLWGDIGVGKSYLATYYTNLYLKLTKYKNKVAFVSCYDRFKEFADMERSYNKDDKERFKTIIEVLSTVPLLVLDGLGNELKTTFVRDAIIYPILANRKKEKLLTIITSNYDIYTIGNMYSFGSEKMHPSAKMIVDMLNYLSNNKQIRIITSPALLKSIKTK